MPIEIRLMIILKLFYKTTVIFNQYLHCKARTLYSAGILVMETAVRSVPDSHPNRHSFPATLSSSKANTSPSH